MVGTFQESFGYFFKMSLENKVFDLCDFGYIDLIYYFFNRKLKVLKFGPFFNGYLLTCVCTSVCVWLPRLFQHMARNRSQNFLHHGQMFFAVMSLEGQKAFSLEI